MQIGVTRAVALPKEKHKENTNERHKCSTVELRTCYFRATRIRSAAPTPTMALGMEKRCHLMYTRVLARARPGRVAHRQSLNSTMPPIKSVCGSMCERESVCTRVRICESNHMCMCVWPGRVTQSEFNDAIY
jgi:hypothetical protein